MKFTCPKGHIIDETQLSCTVDLKVDDIDKATIFVCEVGDYHSFTLKTAIRKKMFTPDHIERLRKAADEHRRKYGYRDIDEGG